MAKKTSSKKVSPSRKTAASKRTDTGKGDSRIAASTAKKGGQAPQAEAGDRVRRGKKPVKAGDGVASGAKAKGGAKEAPAPGGKKAARTKKVNGQGAASPQLSLEGIADSEVFPKDFLAEQRALLLGLRDELVDTMAGVARDNLREHGRSGDASAFGMHQADAGSDAYDRDFALHLLSQEQDALYEINEALKRIETGNYGICEVSGKAIPEPRLRALPFARLTVECQSQVERDNRANAYGRQGGPVFKRAVLDTDNGG